jgi:1-deoxy-D-xylulose-5-phosphate reductoisomerase
MKAKGGVGSPPFCRFKGSVELANGFFVKSSMKSRKLVLLGSTGSIGMATLDVIRRHPGTFAIKALAAYSNVAKLVEQYKEFRPEYICVVDKTKAQELTMAFAGEKVRILTGADELVSLAGLPDVDIVVNAVVGAAGLKASYEAVSNGKVLALANKESLVAGGALFGPMIAEGKATILPIDSEHSAIWQALMAGKKSEVKNIILTASGGPFREWPKERLASVTPEEALNHPTWKMGPKITIDSATLLNKGLEVIEAVTLFGIPPERIKVVIHPQSIIHSMVEFCDSSVIAQISRPDMRLPITYALFWPERVDSQFGQIDWSKLADFSFELPDHQKFPLLHLAFEVAERGGTVPAVYNAANEIAVEAFLARTIKFTDLFDIVTAAVNLAENVAAPTLEDILRADTMAREAARRQLEGVRC